MGNHAATAPEVDQAEHAPHGAERGFAKLDFELNAYPGAVKASLFGIQHVLVMFTAMVGGPLIVGRLLNLPEGTRIAMVSGTMIGCGLMKIGINVASGVNTPAFGKPLTLGLAALMIVLILVITRFAKGFVRALSLFVTMIIGYLVSAAFGLIDLGTVGRADWVTIPTPLPYGGLEWRGMNDVIPA